MTKLEKFAEIKGYSDKSTKEVIETLENKGFVVVDDDKLDTGWKTFHVLKNVETNETYVSCLNLKRRLIKWK